MRTLHVIGALFGALAVLPRAGNAATIVVHASAEVSGVATIDKYGLFGPAGADLSLKPMDIKLSYNSAQYGGSTSCGTNCLSYGTGGHLNGHAATVKVTIGSVTLVYTSTISGQVQFYNNGRLPHSFGIAANGDLTSMTGTGAGVLMWFGHETTFGAKLIRKGRGSNRPQDYFVAFSVKNGKSEELSFSIN